MVEEENDDLTMKQYLTLTRGNQAPSVVKPEIEGNVNFEIKSQFMRELREDAFSGNKNDDAHEHVERVLDIVSLFNIPGVTHDAVMLRVFPITLTGAAKRWVDRLSPGTVDSWDILKKAFIQRYCPPSKTAKLLEDICNFKQEGPILGMTPAQAFTAIQTMVDHSQKWHDGSSSRSINNNNINTEGIAAIMSKLDSLGKEIRRIGAKSSQKNAYSQFPIRCIHLLPYAVKMDDPNITMDIRLKEEKAHRRGKVYNWETATYGKIWYDEDIHDHGSFETEFPAIVLNDASEATLSCGPTVSPLNDNEMDFRISFDKFDDNNYTVIYDENSFSYKIISVNNLKTDSENDNKVNMPLFSSPEPETLHTAYRTPLDTAMDVSRRYQFSDVEDSLVYDRFAKVEGMHAVPPPMTGNYMPPKSDFRIDESKFTYGLGYRFTKKACFVCGSFSHLIRDCNFHEKRMAKQFELNKQKGKATGQGVNRPVWNNVQRLNHQNKFVPKAVDPQKALKNKGIIDSGCSGTWTRNKATLSKRGSRGILSSNARTHNKNGDAERKNHDLLEVLEQFWKMMLRPKLSTARPKLSTNSTKIESMKLKAMIEVRRIFKCWFHYHTRNDHQFTMSNRHQELASLEKTTSGKDFSNPLMADSLPKTIWFSTHHASHYVDELPRCCDDDKE
ncbi:hypothetical protein Tco_0801607 [Tanacetum coccineum]|uniref:Retrotransposon gag domain-containing protein n=1 Tax=Tanacetum coccineum TaxID=301880 RepID=A0ABQ4ZWF8_9ASTR